MKHLKIRGVVQKIIVIPILVVLLSFAMPNYSRAAGIVSTFGGMLSGPIVELFASIFDAIIFGLDGMFYNEKTIGEGVSGAASVINPFDGDALPDAGQTDKYYGPIQEGDTETIVEYSYELDKGVLQWIINPDNYSVPVINLSPKEIFSNEIPALDVNFLNPKYDNNEQYKDKAVTSQLHEIIATWYVSLRNLAVIGLLSVLLYVGIRMMLTSLAAEKAKYKQMFVDWLIALMLIFFLHYIMSFALTITDAITSAIASGVTDVNVYVIDKEKPDSALEIAQDGVDAKENGNYETAFSTNLTGLARFRVQYKNFGARWFNLLMYMAFVILTVMFLYTYVKRVIMMAFLTLIAPLVCLTYPIDKIGDGKAQAFNMWLKEFIFNALLQPFHLLLYAIFIGSAMKLSANNWFYAIVCLVFIFEAEKILKKMFGFEKGGLGTIGTLGGFAGGALAAQFIGKMGKLGGGKAKVSGGSSSPSIATSKNKTKSTDFGAYDGQLPEADAETVQNVENTRPDNNQTRNREFREGVINPQYTPVLEAFEREQEQRREERNTQEVQNNPIEPQVEEGNVGNIRLQGNNDYDYSDEDKALENEEIEHFQDSTYGSHLLRDENGYFKDSLSGVHALAQSKYKGKKKSTVIKGVAKTVGKAYLRGGLALAGATAGAAAGIATGDLDNVFKMGAAGLAAGSAAGKALPGAIGNRIQASRQQFQEKVQKPYLEGMYGQKETQRIIDKQNFKNNQENWDFFREKFRNEDGSYKTEKEIQGIMANAFDYTQKGINDLDDIEAGMKLEQAKKEEAYARIQQQFPDEAHKEERMQAKREAGKKARQQAIFATQWYRTRMNPSDLGDAKKMEDRERYLAQEFKQRGVSDEQARAQSKSVMNDIRILYRG